MANRQARRAKAKQGIREMVIDEIIPDFKVKNPETYHQHRAVEIGLLQYADIRESEDKPPVKERVKVQNVDAEPLQWSEKMEVWRFKATVSFKIVR